MLYKLSISHFSQLLHIFVLMMVFTVPPSSAPSFPPHTLSFFPIAAKRHHDQGYQGLTMSEGVSMTTVAESMAVGRRAQHWSSGRELTSHPHA